MNRGILERVRKALKTDSVGELKRYITRDNVNCWTNELVFEKITVLIEAIIENAQQCVQWLWIEMKPNPGIALIMAIKSGKFACAEWLLEHGCDPNITTLDGCSAFSYAYESIRLVKMLLRYGANPNAVDGGLPIIYRVLFFVNVSPFGTDPKYALIARLLIEAGADVDARRLSTKALSLVKQIKSNMTLKRAQCALALGAFLFCVRYRPPFKSAPHDLTRYLLQSYLVPSWKNQHWLDNKNE